MGEETERTIDSLRRRRCSLHFRVVRTWQSQPPIPPPSAIKIDHIGTRDACCACCLGFCCATALGTSQSQQDHRCGVRVFCSNMKSVLSARQPTTQRSQQLGYGIMGDAHISCRKLVEYTLSGFFSKYCSPSIHIHLPARSPSPAPSPQSCSNDEDCSACLLAWPVGDTVSTCDDYPYVEVSVFEHGVRTSIEGVEQQQQHQRVTHQ